MSVRLLRAVFVASLGIPCLSEDGAKGPVCATGFESPDDLGLYDRLKDHKLVEVVDGQGAKACKALKVTHLLFSTFYGGSDPSWAPKDKDGKYMDVHAYFDNLVVYEGLHIRKRPGLD